MVADNRKYIMATALMTVEGRLQVLVRITDVRTSFGELQAQVSPEQGFGGKWVAFDRLRDIVEHGKTLGHTFVHHPDKISNYCAECGEMAAKHF